MTATLWLGIGIVLAGSFVISAGTVPEAEITDGPVRARVALPDASAGFYRGTRFDWAGVILSLEYGGHNYYGQWYDRSDARVHDFIYEGAEIVAGLCTAVTGPAEEFVFKGKALGFDEAAPGGSFVKIGIGVLRKPDDKNYDPYRLYEIEDGGKWTVTPKRSSIEFRQVLPDARTGYGYDYRKIARVAGDPPRLVLEHTLRNTGKNVIQTSVYNHNFVYLDRQPPGPDYSLTFPFQLDRSKIPADSLAEVRGNQISFSKTLAGEERAYLDLKGFGAAAKDYDIRIENRRLGAGVRIKGDRPLSRVALWAIRAPLSIEPFIDMKIEPGREFTWRIQYEYYTIPAGGRLGWPGGK